MLAAAQRVDAIAALLAAGAVPVHLGRSWPFDEAELPAWKVYAGDESVQLLDVAGRLEEHTLQVLCEGKVHAAADLDDAMHAQAAAALSLLFAAPPFDLQLLGIRRALQSDNQAALADITLELQSRFYVDPSLPETIQS